VREFERLFDTHLILKPRRSDSIYIADRTFSVAVILS
jgi:hypothetical protein